MSRSKQTWMTALLVALLAIGILIALPIGVVDVVFLCLYVLVGLWIIWGMRQ